MQQRASESPPLPPIGPFPSLRRSLVGRSGEGGGGAPPRSVWVSLSSPFLPRRSEAAAAARPSPGRLPPATEGVKRTGRRRRRSRAGGGKGGQIRRLGGGGGGGGFPALVGRGSEEGEGNCSDPATDGRTERRQRRGDPVEFLLGKRAKNPVSVQDIPEAPRAIEERRNRGDCSGPRLRWEERGAAAARRRKGGRRGRCRRLRSEE